MTENSLGVNMTQVVGSDETTEQRPVSFREETNSVPCYSMATASIPYSGEIVVLRSNETKRVSFPVEVSKERERFNNYKKNATSTTYGD